VASWQREAIAPVNFSQLEILFLLENFLSKTQNLDSKYVPFWGNLGAKLIEILSTHSVGKLPLLPRPSTFQPTTLLTDLIYSSD